MMMVTIKTMPRVIQCTIADDENDASDVYY